MCADSSSYTCELRKLTYLSFLVYVLAHELAPGKFRPTPTHSFIRLLSKKELLHTCFTQNIDTLERAAGVPASKIIEAHGSFADQHCIQCGAHYPHEDIKEKIRTQEIPRCKESNCKGYVKPDIVFFGESVRGSPPIITPFTITGLHIPR